MTIYKRIIHLFVLLVIIASLTNCANQANSDDTASNVQQKSEQQITSKNIDNLDFTDYALSDESLRKIASWNQYNELNGYIEALKKANFDFFKEEKSILKTLLDDSVTNLPEQINTKAVTARIIAFQTSCYRLHGELEGSGQSKEATLNAIREVLIAFANLNFQINKKFEKEGQNIQKPS
ncbi:MAG: hypothetical protein ACWA5P_06800 [bacterium]